MPPIPPMCRSVWWAFAVAGAIALVAAAAAALQVASAPLIVGAWQLAAGTLLLIALVRAPVGIAQAMPFIGAAVGGVVLGAVGILLPSLDPRISLIAIGIWAVLAGAGFLAVARLAAAQHVVDVGLLRIAWAAIATGVVVSTFPAFGLGNSPLAPAAALAITGAVTIRRRCGSASCPTRRPPRCPSARRAGASARIGTPSARVGRRPAVAGRGAAPPRPQPAQAGTETRSGR